MWYETEMNQVEKTVAGIQYPSTPFQAKGPVLKKNSIEILARAGRTLTIKEPTH
jgi:hypothetical protein